MVFPVGLLHISDPQPRLLRMKCFNFLGTKEVNYEPLGSCVRLFLGLHVLYSLFGKAHFGSKRLTNIFSLTFNGIFLIFSKIAPTSMIVHFQRIFFFFFSEFLFRFYLSLLKKWMPKYRHGNLIQDHLIRLRPQVQLFKVLALIFMKKFTFIPSLFFFRIFCIFLE